VNRLNEILGDCRKENRAALIGYLPAGFPSLEGSIAAMRAMVEGGCDIIEVGLPYSDPAMDGPVIQAAADKALALGTTTPDVIRAAGAVADTGAAALVMSYWNPIEHYGVGRFAEELAKAGGSGVITPDLIPEEAGPWVEATDEYGISRVFLVAPSSSDERIALTAGACTGFVYAGAVMGVTGARDQVGSAAEALVARTRRATDKPVCVGLGVSTGDQAAEVAAYADGVIVGSAFVRRILDARDQAKGAEAVRQLAAELAAGIRRGSARRA
jgi:tryptophan synthase alpha chain